MTRARRALLAAALVLGGGAALVELTGPERAAAAPARVERPAGAEVARRDAAPASVEPSPAAAAIVLDTIWVVAERARAPEPERATDAQPAPSPADDSWQWNSCG